MNFYKNSRFFSLFTVILLSFSLVLAPLQTATAETNEPEVSENEAEQVHSNENDGDDVDDEVAHAIEEEDGDAGASSDLDGSETTNDESGNTANEQHGQENPSTTNVGEKSAEAESAQVTFAVANDNGSAEDFEYSIKEVTETSFTISWNTVPNISSYDLRIWYFSSNDDYIEKNYEIGNDQNEFTVEDLLPNTDYDINLITNDTNGQQKRHSFYVKTNGDDANADPVHFEDAFLASAIAKTLGIYGRAVTTEDMKNLYHLDASNSNITSLKGLEHASSLEVLNAEGNNISDISILKELTSLSDGLILKDNNISDISALKNLNIHFLDLSYNNIDSFDSLVGFNNLSYLYLDNNNISSIPKNLNSLPNLYNLTLSGNELTDISNLKGLNDLTYLDLSYNNIKDITVLKELDYNKGSESNKEVFLNGIEITDTDTIAELRNKGIEVHYDKDYEEPGHEDDSDNGGTSGGHDGTPGTDNGTEDDDTTPDSNDGSGQVTPEPELEKVFPKNKGYVVSQNNVTIEVGNQQTAELSAAQVKTLKDNNRSIVIDRNGVDLIIPSSIFNTDENVEISVKKLADVDGSFSTFKFTIKQGGNIVSKFNEPITLSFEVDAAKATNPNNLKIFYLNEETGEWELIGGTYNNGVVTAVTDHFSTFAVFEVEPDSAGAGGPDTEEPAGQNDEEKGQVTVAADKTDGGNQLPNTATNNFNLLLLGAFIIAAGVITFFVRPKRVKAK